MVLTARAEFEKLWKLKCLFPETGQFWKWKVFQNGYGKVLDFCLGKLCTCLTCTEFSIVLNTVYVMFVHITIYNIKYNLPKGS